MSMKNKISVIGLGLLGSLLVVGFSTQLFANLWGYLVGDGYVVPNQSSIFTFQVTEINKGSGDYWLYGEDQQYYYTSLDKELEKDNTEPYAFISKEEASLIVGFDKTNHETWRDTPIACGDILSLYAIKPNGLVFINCERVSNSQTIIEATYSVSGKASQQVEDFLVEHYGMGKLQWVCCGWETAGQYGGFDHADFKKIDPDSSAMISMYSSGEDLETDRAQIDYFTVVVKVVVV